MPPLLTDAKRLVLSGLSVIPVKADGSKQPAIAWKLYQTARASDTTLAGWFAGGGYGLGIIAGAVSGGLEILDFDAYETFTPWSEMVDALIPGLLERLPCVETPTGGRHVYYRCDAITGNIKLAQAEDADTLIETRGEGGYVVAPGSPLSCHLLKRPYQLLDGDLADIPRITPDERAILLNAARTFNRYAPAVPPDHAPKTPTHAADGERPGDAYARRTSWEDLLRPYGWTAIYRRGDVTCWKRPGKDGPGISATTNHDGTDLLYVFSSNASPFEPNHGYAKFTAYALLEHRGDFAAASKTLGSQGYGDRPKPGPRLVTTPTPDTIPPQEGGPTDDLPSIDAPYGDVYNAALLAHRYGPSLRYCEALGGWLLWTGTHWRRDNTGEVMEVARNALRWASSKAPRDEEHKLLTHLAKSYSHSKLNAMLAQAASWPGIACTAVGFDQNPWLLNVANGTLDLRTASLRPHAQTDYLTRCLTTPYDPQATAPTWQGFLWRIMGGDPSLNGSPVNDKAKRLTGFLQRAVGYSLTGITHEDCLFLLYGSGRNGKSRFLAACHGLLEGYARTAQMNTFLHQERETVRNDLADLHGARLVSAIESTDGSRFAEGLIKQLTGSDPLKARFLYKDYFEFLPAFKIFLALNHKPQIRGTDTAIWERIRLIPFEVFIPPAERDKQLDQKLAAERPGILAWAVQGCLDWQHDGLQEPAEVMAATQGYREEMDTVGAFLRECCLQSPTVRIKASELYAAYERWCSGDHTPIAKNLFGRELNARNFTTENGSGHERWRRGLALKAEEGV